MEPSSDPLDQLQFRLQQVQLLLVNVASKEGHKVCGDGDGLSQGCLGDPQKLSGGHEHHLRPLVILCRLCCRLCALQVFPTAQQCEQQRPNLFWSTAVR